MEAFPEEGMTELYLNELVKYNEGGTQGLHSREWHIQKSEARNYLSN